MSAPEDLLERIRLRLDESFVGIGEVVAELQPADIADLVNQLTRQEAAAVMSMLAVPRAVEVFDQPTLNRRSADPRGRWTPAAPPRSSRASPPTSAPRSSAAWARSRAGASCPSSSAEVRAEVERLLQYPPHSAGGIMTTEFVRLDPALDGRRVPEAHPRGGPREGVDLRLLRDGAGHRAPPRLGVAARPRDGRARPAGREVMRQKPVTVSALDDQEAVAGKIAKYNLLAVPVLEKDGSVVGFVTVDDVIDVMIEEGTEDALRDGRRRARRHGRAVRWPPRSGCSCASGRAGCIVLFLSEMLTATAMGRFEEEIARAVVLALFVPLIISSGGNSGSQAASLIIRALAVGELRVRDWWRVMRREILSGLTLGSILGFVGFLRITRVVPGRRRRPTARTGRSWR